MNHATVALLACLAATVAAAEVQQLDTVEVTADEAAPEPGDVPLGLSFSGDELMAVPGAGGDVLRAIEALPGVAVNEDGEGGVAIRGSRPENNLYFVDFMPTGYLFHFTGNSVIDGDLVKRFDFYPAGFGAEYQTGIGGVIDVTTRDPAEQRRTMLDISLIDTGVLVEGKTAEHQSGLFSARMSYYDLLLKDIIDDGDDTVKIVQLPKYFDYRGKYLIDLSGQRKLRLFVDGAADEAKIIIEDDDDLFLQDPVLVGEYKADVNYHRQAMTLQGETAAGGRYRWGLSNRDTTEKGREGNAGSLKIRQNALALKGEYLFVERAGHQLKTGATLKQHKLDYDARFHDPGCTEFDADCRVTDAEEIASSGKLTVRGVQAYLEDGMALSQRTTLTLGLGVNGEDYLDKTKLEPRIRLEYAADNELIFSAAAGRYHEFPDFAQVEKVFGNPELEYMRSDHLVAGVEQRRGDGWYWKSEIYYKTFDDLVTSDEVLKYTNHGEGRAKGVEVLVRKTLTDLWSGWLALSWSDANRKDSRTGQAFDFEFDQPLIATLVARRKLNERFAISGKVKFHSGAPYTPVIGAEPDVENPGSFRALYGDINSRRLPAYFRLDLRVDYKAGIDGLSLYGEIVNATAHRNVSGYSYNADYSEREEVTQLPGFVYFGVKKEWR